MFSDFLQSIALAMLKFDWFSFFGGAKEVVDIIWAGLTDRYGKK